MPSASSSLQRVVGDVDLRSCRHQDQLRLAARAVVQHVGAALDRVVRHGGGVPHRQPLARQRERRRPVGLAQRVPPRERGLVVAGRTHDVDVGRRAQRDQLLDRLVRRPVLADADRVVREHERRRDAHDRREPDRGLHVVAEDQEAGAVGAEAGQRQAVDDRAHRVLADAEVQVAPAVLAGLDAAAAVDQRERGGSEVGRAADHLRHRGGRPLDHLLRRLARGDHARVRALLRHVAAEPVRQRAREVALQLGRLGAVLGAVGVEALLPLGLLLAAALDAAAEVLERLVRDVERLLARVAVDLLGEPDLLLAERRAVRAVRVLLVRRAGRDVRAHDDQARPVGDLARGVERRLQRVELEVLAEVLDVPAVGLVARADVLGERQRRVALDRDVVVVVEADQPAEAEVAGDRRRLRRDPLLEVAVGDDEVRVAVDRGVLAAVEARGQHALAERHPDGGRDPLPERPRGRLDARHVAVLGVARAGRVELAEALDLVERDVVAGQVERRVEQHRRVPAGEHEAVAAGPVRLLRRVPHDARVEQVRDRRQRHRRAGVAGVRLLDGVHGERADRVHAQLVQRPLVGTHRHAAPVRPVCVTRKLPKPGSRRRLDFRMLPIYRDRTMTYSSHRLHSTRAASAGS